MISGIVRRSKSTLSFVSCPRCKCRVPEFHMDKSRDPVWYEVMDCSECGLEVQGYGALSSEWEKMDTNRWWKLRLAYLTAYSQYAFQSKRILPYRHVAMRNVSKQ